MRDINIQQTSQAKTVAQAVYENLRQSILDGTLEADTKLNQDALAQELGVSRMPVRESLGRLEAEGLVVFEPYRGAFVAPLTLEELEQIYLMRLALEPLLARLGAQQLHREEIDQLQKACQRMVSAVQVARQKIKDETDAGDAASIIRSGQVALFQQVRVFHETLYAAADKPLILTQVQSLRAMAERYIRRYLTLPGRLAHVVRNHQELLEAASQHDPARVEHLVREELEVTRDALFASLSAKDRDSSLSPEALPFEQVP
jgi:DNA-binding GntR family transcriptional regulator